MLIVIAYVFFGAIVFRYVDPEYTSQGSNQLFETTFVDAVYFSVVTISTVGYGDVVPSDDAGKLFFSFYILLSLFLLGGVLELTEFFYSIDIGEVEEGDDAETIQWFTRSRRRLFFNLAVVFILMLLTSVWFTQVEGFTTVDAFYFVVSSLSTVGYGDLAPQTQRSRLLSIFWLTFGTFALLRLVGSLTEVVLESRKRRWMEKREQRDEILRQHLSARVSIIGMQNLSETEIIRTYTKRELLQVLNKMEYILFRAQEDGHISLEDLRKLDSDFKALTPEAIEEEFASSKTKQVFNSIVGNIEP